MSAYFLGVDLGQSHDFSTIAVVERAELRREWDAALFAYRKATELRLRMLERIPLGTPYPEVTARVAEVTHARALAAGTRHLAVDATGVGRPVVDLLRRARPAATLMPVVVTPGERQSLVGDTYHVPKRDLITGLVVLFQQGLLQIARGLSHAATLVEELRSMQVRAPGPGREQWGAWRSGTHDDLVFAVALACWAAGQVHPAKREEWWTNRREAEAAEVFRKAMEGRTG